MRSLGSLLRGAGDALGASLASRSLPAAGRVCDCGGRGGVYLLPVPTRYVLVPCRVMGPGLQPKTRTTRLDSCSMRCRAAAISASETAGTEIPSHTAARRDRRPRGRGGGHVTRSPSPIT